MSIPLHRKTVGAVLAALAVGGVGVYSGQRIQAHEDTTVTVSRPGYSRDQFGPAWADLNANGCDERDDALARDLTYVVRSGCDVLSGTLVSKYTGGVIQYRRGDHSPVDVDHIYPLRAAWDAGADQWTRERRIVFASDLDNLLTVDASSNRSKGQKTPGQWMPPNKLEWCDYSRRFEHVAEKYDLPISVTDRKIVTNSCPVEVTQ